MKEFDLIKRIGEILEHPSSNHAIGIGDDCAVILPDAAPIVEGHSLLMSCDTMIENRHFYRKKAKPDELGWKLMAQATSDIAAMGGVPIAATIAINISQRESEDFLSELYSGANKFCQTNNFLILGGDTSSATEFSLSATVLGSTSSPAILRSNGIENDDIWVSGSIGAAGAGLQIIQGLRPPSAHDEHFIKQQNQPSAQIKLGPQLAGVANSMIDISDGLIADLRHLCEASQLSAVLDLESLPLSKGLDNSLEEILTAASSGEDYELLFSCPKTRRNEVDQISKNLGVTLTKIGEFKKSEKIAIKANYKEQERKIEDYLLESGLPKNGGWEHQLKEQSI